VSTRLVRWSAWLIIADGVIWLVYAFVTLQYAPSYWAASSLVDYLAVDLYSGGLVLLGIGLTGIHGRQARKAGPEEYVGFFLALLGALTAGVGDFAEDGLHLALAGQYLWGPGMLLLLAGLVIFSVGTLHARVFPIWFGLLLLASPIAGFVFRGLGSEWRGTAAFGLFWIVLGGYLTLNRHDSP
jgi:hypothetical protein